MFYAILAYNGGTYINLRKLKTRTVGDPDTTHGVRWHGVVKNSPGLRIFFYSPFTYTSCLCSVVGNYNVMKTLYVDYIMRILHLDFLKTNPKKIIKIEGYAGRRSAFVVSSPR